LPFVYSPIGLGLRSSGLILSCTEGFVIVN